jgi:ribosomal protein S2
VKTIFNKTNQIINQLLSDNCLSFGRSPKLNNRKITHYISGTRGKTDIFNFYQMRYLLLKVYPLIHNLFLQQRLNTRKKKKIIFEKKLDFQNSDQKLPKQFQKWEDFRNFKMRLNKPLRAASRPLLPKILFATTTELYSSIVSSAAAKCHMPFHVNRWLSGTITAAASYLDDFEKWSFLINDLHQTINNSVQEKFFKRKKNLSQQAKQSQKYQLGRKPSLIIIPDVSNNEMIIKETNAFGIPVLGLVNSNCNSEIAYPIFANDLSIYSIQFFCHFLSTLITKEIVKTKHKFYIAKKKTVTFKFPQAMNDIFLFNIRTAKLKFSKKRNIEKKYLFQGRYFLDNLVKPKIKIKKKLKYSKNKHWSNKPKKSFISPKKLIIIENQKRLEKSKKSYYLKNRVLPRIKIIKKVHHFNFPKIVREIRLPMYKPKFRFWNQNKFFFSNTLQFSKNTSIAFQVKRFMLPKLLRKRFWKLKRLGKNKNKIYKHKMYNPKLNFEKLEKFNNKYKKFLVLRKRWSKKNTRNIYKNYKNG